MHFHRCVYIDEYPVAHLVQQFRPRLFYLCLHCHCIYLKARACGRVDHFAAGVTYLQFPVQVCFSSM